jgi:hypothetical protein
MGFRSAIAFIVGLGLWLIPTPAFAFGSLTHTLIADRAYGLLVAKSPWLGVHRDAFLWGAIAADFDHPGGAVAKRAHSPGVIASLWREAKASGDSGTQAFVLGWAVHIAADELAEAALSAPDRHKQVRIALEQAGAHDLPMSLDPLMDWAVDAALVPVSDNSLVDLYRCAYLHAASPAGAPMRGVMARVLGADESSYFGWARLQTLMSAGGIDRYLTERSRYVRVEPWTVSLRAPAVRQALGDLTPLLAQSVKRGVDRVSALLDEDAAKTGSRRP